MIGITIQVEGEAALGHAFAALDTYLSDLRPIWPGVAGVARDVTRERFAAEGPGWPDLSEAYARLKAARHGARKVLHATGELEDSLTKEGAKYSIYEPEPDSLTVGSSHPAALAHQQGVIERSLPARVIYLVDGELERRVEAVIERDLTDFAEGIGLAA